MGALKKPRCSLLMPWDSQQGPVTSLPILPLRGTVIFPGTSAALLVGRRRSLAALRAAREGGLLLLVAQRDAGEAEPSPDGLHRVGTLAVVRRIVPEEGMVRVTVEALARTGIEGVAAPPDPDRPWSASWVRLEAPPEAEADLTGLVRLVWERAGKLVHIRQLLGEDQLDLAALPSQEPDRFSDLLASLLPLPQEDKQALLETVSVAERLKKLAYLIQRETEIAELERKLQHRVRRQMERQQREHFLREQLKAIRAELGEEETVASETEAYRRRVKACGLPPDAEEKVLREVNRLAKMPPQSAEAVVLRGYLDWVTGLPWSERTEDCLDLDGARAVLDEDHFGLEAVKERILDFLAVRRLAGPGRGSILCLVGPPGVGKSSLARSVARALGRRFVRVSLGGVRDEAEIRGHRRTYVGALPGRIIQGMRQAGSRNPVFLLDELDKMASDFHGDPAAALLEVLDPEHNRSFSDHFVELPFDLSEVLFVTTANTLYTIPRPLLDRLEVIVIPGYTEEEKVQIALRHLWPRLLASHGLAGGAGAAGQAAGGQGLTVAPSALRRLIREYTREAGVRNLERHLAAICRRAARRLVSGQAGGPERIRAGNLAAWLGPPPFKAAARERSPQVGACLGLGWTEYGGDVMTIEVSVLPGQGQLVLTGKMGEVMRESAQAGFSFVRSRAESLGIQPFFHQTCDLHVHVLEGAVPKEGPSAGVTIATAMVSALTGVPVRADVALTGEITLRGRVLPVGGVREKVLAAQRAGVRVLVLPAANRSDVAELPPAVRRRVRFVFVEDMDQVLAAAMAGAPRTGAMIGGQAGGALAGAPPAGATA